MKTVIEMAREAGINHSTCEFYSEEVKAFAELVRADEREECIDLVAIYGGPVDLEAAIRARGNK